VEMQERRGRSRAPLKLLMTAVLLACALWLAELYTQPTWAKIRSFLLGYFLGTFVMEWIWQRTSRGVWGGGNEGPTAEPAALPAAVHE
jgi:Flp pilus assembly protein TadB